MARQMLKNSERRSSKRFDMPIDIEYRTLTHSPATGKVVAQNISLGGLAVSDMKNAVETGITVQLKMCIPGNPSPVEATGLIAWTSDGGAGLRLTKISKLDQERLLECVYQSWLDQNTKG